MSAKELTELVTSAKPWLDMFTFLLVIIATVLSIYSTLIARTARRRLTITEPEDGEVHKEWATISGIGARPSSRVLVLHRTSRWFLQKEAATPSKLGSWVHEHCHFRAVNEDRTVVALTVRPREVDKIRQAFGDWGPDGNRTQIGSWDELLNLLNGLRVRCRLSEPRRIRRPPSDPNSP